MFTNLERTLHSPITVFSIYHMDMVTLFTFFTRNINMKWKSRKYVSKPLGITTKSHFVDTV